MPSANLLTLLDEITTLLDDVSAMTKVATKKTAGVLGDDLALNAEQLTQIQPQREIPVVWAVAKGSFLNKAILVPVLLLISALAPWLVVPLLMIGGAYLCFEGFEKLVHKFLHRRETEQRHAELVAAVVDPTVDLVAFEKPRIKGAIRTDFILSAEILVISLGTAANASFTNKAILLVVISIVFTIFVYGLVAGIVKLDDLGLKLRERSSAALKALGAAILKAAPFMIRGLSIAGTAAMFLVGGGIVVHGISVARKLSEALSARVAGVPVVGSLASILFDAIVGIALGAVLVLLVTLGSRIFKKKQVATG